MAWNVAEVKTAASVTWSNGTPFDGYILFNLVLPTGYTSPAKSDAFPPQKLPTVIKIPIRAGVVNNRTKVPFTTAYLPPGVVYTSTWYDQQDNVISGPSASFSVTADPYTISVPTLTIPA
jgi:hypothetical protein